MPTNGNPWDFTEETFIILAAFAVMAIVDRIIETIKKRRLKKKEHLDQE